MPASQAHALEWQNSPELGKLFADAVVQGTFVLYDADVGRLIGLSLDAVKSVDEVLPYGDKPQPFKTWEQDMGLREAIKVSSVPVYQELARRIGLERMRNNVSRMGFGNGEIGSDVDNFWLIGPLKISAVDQVLFLVRLARDELTFPKEAQAKVREIVQLEQGNGWTLCGKTGWVNAPKPGIGWWVGWVIKENHVYSFALNIDITQASDAAKRIELSKASLKALGVL